MDDSEEEQSLQELEEIQKYLDLDRAMYRTKRRPGKKEKRFSEIEGRYVPPPELQKEIDRLKAEKEKAEQRKKGLFGLFAREEKPEPQEETDEKPQETEKQKRAKQIKKLRGIKKTAKKHRKTTKKEEPAAVEKEEEQTVKRPSFLETVRLLNEESAKADVYTSLISLPAQKNLPDETFVDNAAFPLGIIYWNPQDQLLDRVIVVHQVLRRCSELLIGAYAPDTGQDGIIPANRVVRLYDLGTMREIENPYEFITETIKTAPALSDGDLPAILAVMRYELVILAAVRAKNDLFEEREKKVWLNYISMRCGFIDFDVSEMLDYIKTLEPDDQTFHEAVDVLVGQPQDLIFGFVRTFLQLVMGDGVVRRKQRELLAELLFALRSTGIELNILGLR